MTEPTLPALVGVVAVGVTLFGKTAGPYAAIALSSLAGALWALSAVPTKTRASGAALVARLVLTAVVLTVGASRVLERQYGWSGHEICPVVAFFIGLGGDRWLALRDFLLALAKKRLFGAGDRT